MRDTCRSSALSTAGGADAGDEHAVAEHLEVLPPGHRVANPLQVGAVELDQPVADLAIEMIVAGIAVVVLVDAPAARVILRSMPASTSSPACDRPWAG